MTNATSSDTPAYNPCPLCCLYDFITVEDERTVPWDEESKRNHPDVYAKHPEGAHLMASIYCDDCNIQVSGNTLQEAVAKWNKLFNL